MFIDTHCHLDFKEFDEDRSIILGNAKKANVKKFINPGADIYSSKRAADLAAANPGIIFAGVGFHPYEAQHNRDIQDLEKIIKESGKNIVAVGECGLDYHQYIGENALGKKDNQKRMFSEHLELAAKYDLPIIMHVRDAFEDFFSVVDSMPTLPRGVIHCFSGGAQDLRMADERKLYVGIDGNVTYSKQLWMSVPQIPLRMLLLETDSPLLTPIPHRGTRNEPKYIPLIARKIAELTNHPVQDIENVTSENAKRLFELGNI